MVAVPWVKLGASSDESDTLVDTAPLALPTFSRTDFRKLFELFLYLPSHKSHKSHNNSVRVCALILRMHFSASEEAIQ